jgi:stage II sporulation protein D
MKRVIAYVMFLVSAAVIPAIPAISAKSENSSPKSENLSQEEKASELTETAETAENTAVSYEPYRVLNCSTGEIQEVSVRDYVIGAVAAEMPASFAEEALKAQAVAAHTYAERQRNLQKKYPDKALGNADFSDDPNKYQGFYTDEKIRYYFGDNYDVHYNKIAEAVVSKLNNSVRHGHWEEFHCSVCGEMGWDNEDKYCSNCGAKMDEEGS